MPKAFDACVKRGGRVRTQVVGADRYRKLCFAGGKGTAGHTHTRKGARKGKKK